MGKSERDTYVEHWGGVPDASSSWPNSVLKPSRTARYGKRRRRWPLIVFAAAVAIVLIAWLMRGTAFSA